MVYSQVTARSRVPASASPKAWRARVDQSSAPQASKKGVRRTITEKSGPPIRLASTRWRRLRRVGPVKASAGSSKGTKGTALASGSARRSPVSSS